VIVENCFYNDVYTLLKLLLECFTKCFTKCFYSCCLYSVGSWHSEAISRYRRRRIVVMVRVRNRLPDSKLKSEDFHRKIISEMLHTLAYILAQSRQ